jgi:high-affinity Fe2+/Pb2+ permease
MEEQNCSDCKKNMQRNALIGVVAGAAIGAGMAFVILRYVRK